MFGKLEVTTRVYVTNEDLDGDDLTLALYSQKLTKDMAGPEAVFDGYARQALQLQRYNDVSILFDSTNTVTFTLPSEPTLVTHAGIFLVRDGVDRLLAFGVVQGQTTSPVDMLTFGPGNVRVTRAAIE